MNPSQSSTTIPAGWVGGFAESNPAFAYPTPDLSSLDMLGNMDNIDKLTRQQKVIWPEFSWETIPGEPDSRCYQMFSPDISRLGYTDAGRVYSIICPQQGFCSPALGAMNVEVTVTGQRGWADEPSRTLAADMTVEGTIWFSPSAHQNPFVKILWEMFSHSEHPFPSSKADAISVKTHKVGDRKQPIFPLRVGQSTNFPIPDFAKHPEAWAVANLGVEIGRPKKTGDPMADEFNHLIMDVFNTASGNMLKANNVLTWNVWFTPPELVDQQEWQDHAELWRESIDADHGSPTGEGTPARYYDGTPFEPMKELLEEEIEKVEAYIARHA